MAGWLDGSLGSRIAGASLCALHENRRTGEQENKSCHGPSDTDIACQIADSRLYRQSPAIMTDQQYNQLHSYMIAYMPL